MWSSSFADLAKKAQEMQEQAASSLANPSAFSAMGGPGGLFNLDQLQEEGDTQPSATSQSAPKPAASRPRTPPRQAAVVPQNTSNIFGDTGSSMFGQMSSLYNTPSPTKAPAAATTTPTRSFQSKIPSAAPTSSVPTPKPAVGKTTTLGGIKQVSSPPPKGKLLMPTKSGGSTTSSKSGSSATKPATAAAATTFAPTKTPENVSSPDDKQQSTAEAQPTTTTITAEAVMDNELVPIPSPKQSPDESVSQVPDILSNVHAPPPPLPPLPATPSAPMSALETEMSMVATPTSPLNDDRHETPPPPPVTPVADHGISFSIPTPEAFGDHDFEDDDFSISDTELEETPKSPVVGPTTSSPVPPTTDDGDDNAKDAVDSITPMPPQSPTNIIQMNGDTVDVDAKSEEADASPLLRPRGMDAPPSPPPVAYNGHGKEDGADDMESSIRQQMQQQFTDQLQRLEENHQAEQAARQAEFEQTLADLRQQLRDKEEQLQEQSMNWNSIQEGSSKETATLQNELYKAKELLADKEREDRRLQEAHLKQLRDMEKEVFKKDDMASGLKKTIKELEQSLEASKGELEKSQSDYIALKERAKSVAGELKERRVECRTLASELEMITANNKDLQDRVTQLEAVGMDMNESSKEIQEELASLRSSLKEKEMEVAESQKLIGEERKKGEDALTAYKKKAQQSLALANSRAASAVQAKEEAEMEARAARSTADSAMQRAMAAESSGKHALAEAKQFVSEMETEVAKYNEVKSELDETKKGLEIALSESKKYQESNEKLKCELTSVVGRLEAEHATNDDLKKSLVDSQNRSSELYEEVERLRKECHRHQDEIRRLSDGSKSQSNTEPKVIVRHERNPEAEATIAMLKQELAVANQAIKDLKETLKATMEEQEATQSPQPQTLVRMNGHSDGGMPLFYAMEKQAELTQARDEIARLANLLGDAESTKQEAFDAMHEMKILMEDAQAKLQRQERLKTNPQEGNVNLEYLKNIVLSYLNATSPDEKKTLLPVIGTVLCLTPEEQRKAMEAVDKGHSSVMDSVATSVLNMKWR